MIVNTPIRPPKSNDVVSAKKRVSEPPCTPLESKSKVIHSKLNFTPIRPPKSNDVVSAKKVERVHGKLLQKKSSSVVKGSKVTSLKIKPRHHNFRSSAEEIKKRAYVDHKFKKKLSSSKERAYTPLQQMVDGKYDNLPIPQPDSGINKAKIAARIRHSFIK